MTDRRNNKTIEITYRDEVGETDSRAFAKWMGVGATAMMLLLVATISVGMIAAALGVGIGGFVASFGQVDVDVDDPGGAIYPVLGSQPACDEAPQLNANFAGDAAITEHVAFYKDLPLPASFDNASTARINIVSDDPENLVITDLDLRMSALYADELVLDATNADGGEEIEISEFAEAVDEEGDAYDSYAVDGDDNPIQGLGPDDLANNTEFGIGIPANSTVGITNGLAAAHQVAFQEATLPEVDIFITIGDTGEFEPETNVSDRAVQPAQRTCDALANASSPGTYENYP